MISDRKRIWIAGVPAAMLPCISAFFYFVLATEGAVTQAVYSLTKVFTLLWPLVAWWIVLGRRVEPWAWRQPRHWRSIASGLGTGLVISAFIWLCFQSFLGDVVRENAPVIRERTEAMGVLDHYLLFALFLSVIHSLMEEYYWRWFVYGRLAELLHGWWPHLIAGLAFAAHHMVVLGTFFGVGWGIFFGIFVGLGGIIWSLMFKYQKSLIGIWVSHMLVDLTILGLGYQLIMQ